VRAIASAEAIFVVWKTNTHPEAIHRYD